MQERLRVSCTELEDDLDASAQLHNIIFFPQGKLFAPDFHEAAIDPQPSLVL